MVEVEWTNDLVIRLMEEFKNRPQLWDPQHDMYRIQTSKYEAWSHLASIFECDIADLRKKLNSVFASHRREKAKVRGGTKSKWFLYPYMSFLPNHLSDDHLIDTSGPRQKRITASPSPDTDASSDDKDHDDDDLQQDVIIKCEPETYDATFKPVKSSTHKPRLTRPLKRRIIKDNSASQTSQLDSKLIEMLRLLRRSNMRRKKDECDSFGEYIADSLRKHDDRTQSMIKQAINNILFEQEMKKYSTGQYAVVISNIDDNPLILGDSESGEK